MSRVTEPLVFELSSPGRVGVSLPDSDVPAVDLKSVLPKGVVSDDGPALPEVSEVDAVRHFTRLSRKNYGVDVGFYPLGSCTMKYNPKVNEDVAKLPGFALLHPYQPMEDVQGALEVLYSLERYLCEIGGMDRATLQPAAGAQGELTGLMVIRAYHNSKGEGEKRRKILVPDSSHGTNPASAALCGFEVVEVRSADDGSVDLDSLRQLADSTVAGLMLTNPNTLGLFEKHIEEIVEIIHGVGGLAYYDGANLNAIMGMCRPGDMGFDVMHFNLHKTFSAPHGGGGPGSGPVAVKEFLAPFLPFPRVVKAENGYRLDYDCPSSIGRVRSFYGNFAVCLKAYVYIRSLGASGLRAVSENAVLNANYLMEKLKAAYDLPYHRRCMHEFVLSAKRQKKLGVRAGDIAKRLLDFGYHAPTVYFPLIVQEALMIEPTETESVEVLDAFADALLAIAAECEQTPDVVKSAPHNTPVGRLDEVRAARQPDLRWRR